MAIDTGTLDTSGVTVKIRNGFTACEYQLEGRGTLANGVINATLTGPVSAASPWARVLSRGFSSFRNLRAFDPPRQRPAAP